jgi:hypothetical protein
MMNADARIDLDELLSVYRSLCVVSRGEMGKHNMDERSQPARIDRNL